MSYTYVRRLSSKRRIEVEGIIASLNELAGENEEVTGRTCRYELVKIKDCYIVTALFSDGGTDRGSLVQCNRCGAIRDLWDGQIEFCTDCWEDW